MPPDERRALQTQLLTDAAARAPGDGALPAPPDADLHELMPPRVAWIEEDGGFQLFGQRWPIPETTPRLDELGIPRLFPEEPFDRAAALQTLLHTLLLTYMQLTSDLLRPIQPYTPVGPPRGAAAANDGGAGEGGAGAGGAGADGADGAPEAPTTRIQDHLRHLETAVINFQYLVNQLRPVQASASLEQLLAQQVARRERQTRLLRAKSAAIREEIARLSL